MIVSVHDQREIALPQIVHALNAARAFLGGRKNGKDQRRQNSDDGNDDQQFDQCERSFWARRRTARTKSAIRFGRGKTFLAMELLFHGVPLLQQTVRS
jgi:hypothetical protein